MEINSIDDHHRLLNYLKEVSKYLGKEVILSPENSSKEDKKLIIVDENNLKFASELSNDVIPNQIIPDNINTDNTKSLSIISLTILLLLLIWNVVPIVQIRMQLISDFIPNSLVYHIAKPFIYISSILFLVNIIACIFYFKEKYQAVIILGCLAFCLHGLYLFMDSLLFRF